MFKRLLKSTVSRFLVSRQQTERQKPSCTQELPHKNKIKRGPCAGLWNTPMVHVNGDVTTCCLDEGLVNRIGNLNVNTLEELWNSPKINRWRLAQVEGRFNDSGPLCNRCNWQSAGLLSSQDAQHWLKQFKTKEKQKQ
ncbi:MAG: hypothetical protein CMK59_02480 [Proteobacteria bacterium]|nr:hypothetical protein [Pseudomonadota bacterium]